MNKGLPLYNCHKQVRAAKIKAISLGEVACAYEYKGGAVCGYGPDEPMHNGTSSAVVPVLGRHDYKPERPSKEGEEFVGAILVPEDERLGEIIVNHAYVRKHNPQVGGYYVVYADGYESFSPAQAFEEGYTLAPQTPEPVTA